MKKKMMLALCLVLATCLLGGCATMSLSRMDAMFRNTTADNQPAADPADVFFDDQETPLDADTVTISRELYERYQQFNELLELMDSADAYFYKETDHTKMLQGASAGLLSALEDPYTFYYTPEDWQKMWEDDKGEYAGIGVMISANYSTQLCTISRVFKGSPAEAAGVHRGDILYKVNGDLTVTAQNLQEAVDIMRGTPGTTVDVTFLRGSEELTFTLERAMITVNQIESAMLSDGIGYIAMYEFAGKCQEEFTEALNELLAQGAKGLIIDLRDNGGGWVDAARDIGDLFMDEGDLCYLVYRDGSEDHIYPTKDGKTEIPLVMLVNENSASASEMLTVALRETAGATVVGVKTFGKGIVQSVIPVGQNGAGFQITVAQYFSPLGTEVHGIGITPDVEVPLPDGDNGMYDFADTEKDVQLKKAVEVMLEKIR